MHGGSLINGAGSLHKLFINLFFYLFLFTGCQIFSLRTPESEAGDVIDNPRTFHELLEFYKESIIAANIDQYQMLLSDSFRFTICDRIYYSNPEYYSQWDKNREIAVMQNLFLALSRGESYPVFFEQYKVLELDTTGNDSQFARVKYKICFIFNSGDVDTVSGYLEFVGVRNIETWQVDSIRDLSDGGTTCLSDIKNKFLAE